MSAHTPGPWMAKGLGNAHAACIATESGERIATMPWFDVPGKERDRCHANAKLIAACPAMLEFMQQVASRTGVDGLSYMAEIRFKARALLQQLD